MEDVAPKRKHWLIMTAQAVGPNQVSKIISWDYATEEEMLVFYKKVLPPGTHFIAPLEGVITIENVVQTQDNTPNLILKN